MAYLPLLTITTLLLLISSPIALSLPSDDRGDTVPTIATTDDDSIPVGYNGKYPLIEEEPVVADTEIIEVKRPIQSDESEENEVGKGTIEKEDDEVLTPKEPLTIVSLRPMRRFNFSNRRFGGGRRGFRCGGLRRLRGGFGGDKNRARFDRDRIDGARFERVEFRPRMMRIPLFKYRPMVMFTRNQGEVMFPQNQGEDREGMVLGEFKDPRVFFHSHHNDHEHEHEHDHRDHDHEFDHHDHDHDHEQEHSHRDHDHEFDHHDHEHHEHEHEHDHRDHEHDHHEREYDHHDNDHDPDHEYDHRHHHHPHHHGEEGRDVFENEGMQRMDSNQHDEQDDGVFSKIRKFLSPF